MYMSRLKFRPLVWRNTHPYVLIDRIEDVTEMAVIEANKMVDRTIAVFGYVRGTHLKSNMKVHLIGAGDFDIADITALDGGCS